MRLYKTTRQLFDTLLLFSLLITTITTATATAQKSSPPQPKPRSYDTHAYYVLELPGQSSNTDAHLIASHLGAEFVEPLGHLSDHYLLRSLRPSTFLARRDTNNNNNNYKLDSDSIISIKNRHLHESVQEQLSERDLVMERFNNDFYPLERSSGNNNNVIMKRSGSVQNLPSVISLDRQVTRKRVKRAFDFDDFEQEQQEEEQMKLQTNLAKRAPPAQRPSKFLTSIAQRFSIDDPLFFSQWHLANDQMRQHSINVTGVWAQNITGNGVNVAIVDDGLDMHSDDLADNFFMEGSWDYNDHTLLPEPRLDDDLHGTRCAGEISAVKNDVCGVGVAHGAGVAGIRILSAAISDADEASALNYQYQNNDIYSCSWGPPDNGKSMDAPSPLIKKAILNGVQNGRAGKGSIFVFASGNGGAVDDQCNFDGYTNSLYSITVSAIDRKGLHPYYSEPCSANMVVTYSSGSGDNIHTTDVGKRQCTDRHGGTSAAAPIAAGIFALVLEARPELTWRDMQHLCVQTARTINDADADWQRTQSGLLYNHKYGFGKLDAYSIVEAAKTHELVKPQAWYEIPLKSVNSQFSASDGGTVSSKVSVSKKNLDDANFERLEHITITVNIEHDRRGDVQVYLTSPHGTRSDLAKQRRFDDADTGFPDWTFMTVKHWGEDPIGDWSLTVSGVENQENRTGTFVDWKMMFWGESIDPSKARQYKLPEDMGKGIILPDPPHPSFSHSSQDKTKEITKPTVHLPDDHGDAPGESHSGGPGDDEQPSSSSPTSSEEQDASLPVGGGNMSSLVKNQTWLFVAAGVVIIFAGGIIAFFIMRRQQRKQAEKLARRGYFFESIPGEDSDDHQMTSLGGPGGPTTATGAPDAQRGESSRSDLERGTGAGGVGRFFGGKSRLGRTRELYDAFGSGSDESGDEGERAALVGGEELDDNYMSEFLADDVPESSTSQQHQHQQQQQQQQSSSSTSQSDEVLFDATEDHHD